MTSAKDAINFTKKNPFFSLYILLYFYHPNSHVSSFKFKLPLGLCCDIKMMIQKFWWGQRGDRRKIHWKKWEILCKPKAICGLGFRDLCKFNDAMLVKQVWRLINDIDFLFIRFSKQNIFQMVQYLKLKSLRDPMLGKAFFELGKSF